MNIKSSHTSVSSYLSLISSTLIILTSILTSSPVDAVTQYHEQGLHGHNSYKYGYDTGDHWNPQQRYEEADGWGNVKGSFSYMDGSGHKVTVHYTAGKNGFYRSDDPTNHKKGHQHHGGHHHSPPAPPHTHHNHHVPVGGGHPHHSPPAAHHSAPAGTIDIFGNSDQHHPHHHSPPSHSPPSPIHHSQHNHHHTPRHHHNRPQRFPGF